MNKWKIVIAFVAVFLAGAVVGVFSTGMVIKHHFRPIHSDAKFQQVIRDRFMDDLSDAVDIAEESIPLIKSELELTLSQLHALRMKTDPQITQILQDGVQRIKSHLNEEQCVQLDAFIEKRKRDRRHGGLFRLPPPPPPMQ